MSSKQECRAMADLTMSSLHAGQRCTRLGHTWDKGERVSHGSAAAGRSCAAWHLRQCVPRGFAARAAQSSPGWGRRPGRMAGEAAL